MNEHVALWEDDTITREQFYRARARELEALRESEHRDVGEQLA